MTISILSGRYAKAAFELAAKDKVLDKVAKDLRALADLTKSSEDFQNFIENPILSSRAQNAVLETLLTKIKAQALTKKFITVLVDNNRIDILSEVTTAYEELIKEHNGEITAQVVSAKALTAKQTKDIEKALTKSLGKKVTIEAETDENILGGVTIKIGSKMIDASVLGQLEKLKIISKNAIANY